MDNEKTLIIADVLLDKNDSQNSNNKTVESKPAELPSLQNLQHGLDGNITRDGRNERTYDERRRSNVNSFGDEVLRLQQRSSRDDRYREKKRELGGTDTGKFQVHSRGDRGPGTGDSRQYGDRLRDTDDECCDNPNPLVGIRPGKSSQKKD